MTLSDDAKAVLAEMDSYLDDMRRYVRKLAADLGMPVEAVRAAIRELEGHGYVTFGPVHDCDDGSPKGSTWWLTETGVAARQAQGAE